MKKGDIVIVPFPFTDLSSIKIRPALVLSASKDYVIVAFITSKTYNISENDILIESNTENGLKKSSVIKLDRLVTLEKGLLEGKLGNISSDETTIINKKLIEILNL